MRSPRPTGFTIIELAIVMLILGIMTATAVPRYFGALASYRANATAKRIVADLALAQRYAKQQSIPQTVNFYPSANRYELPGVSSMDRQGQTYQFEFSQAEYSTVLVSADFAATQQVTYDIYGMPDNPGTIIFKSGNQQYTLNIDNEGDISASAAVTVPAT